MAAVDQVRLLTGLTDTELTDGDIDSFLELSGDDAKLAAAEALEVFASRLQTITVTSDDISIDGSKRAVALLARAARLRAQSGDDGFTFDVVFDGCAVPELTEHGHCC